jgi:hypothetical protein
MCGNITDTVQNKLKPSGCLGIYAVIYRLRVLYYYNSEPPKEYGPSNETKSSNINYHPRTQPN